MALPKFIQTGNLQRQAPKIWKVFMMISSFKFFEILEILNAQVSIGVGYVFFFTFSELWNELWKFRIFGNDPILMNL